jgi:pimeloyl-ACP methyl ester carboxylesterase
MAALLQSMALIYILKRKARASLYCSFMREWLTLEKIGVPTLVIIGDKDVAEFQNLSTLVAEKIEGSRQVIMPGTAHLPSMEKPEAFNQVVLAFLG